MAIVSQPQPLATGLKDPAQDYIYRLSHDLSAPIRAIVQFSQLIEKEESQALSENGHLYMRFVRENGLMLQQMMSALLDLSRIKTPAPPFPTLDVSHCFKEAYTTVQNKYPGVVAQNETENLGSCLCPADIFYKIFIALIDNSFKFAASGKPLRLRLSQQNTGNITNLLYSDNGIGIEQKFFEKLFIPFQRLHTQDAYPGLGVGLAFAQRYAQSIGGSLNLLASKEGASFSFKLPNVIQGDL